MIYIDGRRDLIIPRWRKLVEFFVALKGGGAWAVLVAPSPLMPGHPSALCARQTREGVSKVMDIPNRTILYVSHSRQAVEACASFPSFRVTARKVRSSPESQPFLAS
jgi:hypothetical protein